MKTVRKGIAQLTRDPLIRFFVIGALLFAITAWRTGPESSVDEGNIIRLTDGKLDALTKRFELLHGYTPSEDEVVDILDRYIEEEVLYREAKALGLNEGDAIIRRRLAQKMRLLTESAAADDLVGHRELRAHYETHRKEFDTPARVSFAHVYFVTDDRSHSETAHTAQSVLTELTRDGVTPDQSTDYGDPFSLKRRMTLATRDELIRLFGKSEFVDAVFGAPVGTWHGPVKSGYGLHLVFVEERTPRMPQPFETVREEVRRHFIETRSRQTSEDLLRRLREQYTIEIATDDLPDETAARFARKDGS